MPSAFKEGFERSECESLQTTVLADDLVLLTVSEAAAGTTTPQSTCGHALSPAERAVVRLAALGLSNPAIAETRGCSPRTIANHLASAYRKLGLSGRRQLRSFVLNHAEQLFSMTAEDRGK